MPSANIVKEVDVIQTPRVLQLGGMFDLPPNKRASQSWNVNLPISEKPWDIGLIVGPSGCGKTTIAQELFGRNIKNEFDWDFDKSVLDGFPKEMGIKQISELLNSVGFSSPPSWMKPFHVLSNGEKFRVTVARALAESPDLCVIDEFTSVVDRTVAQIGSAAVSKAIRRNGKKFIAVSCHYDIEEWLQPDWVYKPAENEFQWRLLQRRPEIKLEIAKVHRSAWQIFKQHHYLSAEISKAAQCFVGLIEGAPVVFHSYIHFQNNRLKNTKKGHRLVVLPDYQGAGAGLKMENFTARNLSASGFDYIAQTSHPSIIAYRCKSELWKMISKPFLTRNKGGHGKKNSVKHFGRMLCTFRYVGPKNDPVEAKRLGYV